MMSWFVEYKSLLTSHKLSNLIAQLPDNKRDDLVTEKVHGCNFSVAFIKTGDSCRIEFASRCKILPDKENFHSYRKLFDVTKCAAMSKVFNSMDYSCIRFIGELYGTFFREIKYNDMEELPIKYRVFHVDVWKNDKTCSLDWEKTKAMSAMFNLPVVPIIAENCTVLELKEILATIETRNSAISDNGFEGICVTIDGEVYKRHVNKFCEDKVLPSNKVDKTERMNELLNSERLIATINNANSKFNFNSMKQFKQFKQFIIEDIQETHGLQGVTTGLKTKFLDAKIRELLL